VRFSRPLGVTLSCAALALAATACSSSAKSSDAAPAPSASAVAPSDASSAPASAAASAGPDLSTMSGDQILKASEAAAAAAQSVKIDMQTVDSSGTTKVKVATDTRSGCTGTITMPGKGTVDVVQDQTKTTYLKPDDTYWKSLGGAKAVTLFHGRWLTGPASDPAMSGMIGFCDIKALVAQMDDGSKVTKGQATTLNGQPAQTLTTTAQDGTKSTLWVAAQGAPYPLQATGGNGAGNTDKMTLTDYNVPVTVTAPPADQVVDIAKLKAASGH
jgi:hypothetical protein